MSDILTIEQLTERRSSRSDFVEVHEIIASHEALRKERDIANAKLLETTKRLAHMSVDLAAAERVVEAVKAWRALPSKTYQKPVEMYDTLDACLEGRLPDESGNQQV